MCESSLFYESSHAAGGGAAASWAGSSVFSVDQTILIILHKHHTPAPAHPNTFPDHTNGTKGIFAAILPSLTFTNTNLDIWYVLFIIEPDFDKIALFTIYLLAIICDCVFDAFDDGCTFIIFNESFAILYN